MGQDCLALHNSPQGLLPGTTDFSRENLHICLGTFKVPVLSVCAHQKELAEALSPFRTLRAQACDPVFS